ncbi:MAG: hypothetical protein GDA40_11795 [Rhodobacteraceae bacterium]|nr:hypothetical protein [Paracoccaceae bacterium]
MEADGALFIQVVANGGNITTFQNLQAEELTMANLTVDDWNSITDPNSGLIATLIDLDFDLG